MAFNEFEGETFRKIEINNPQDESNTKLLEDMILVSYIVGPISRHIAPGNIFISLDQIISLGYHKDESLYIFEIEPSRTLCQTNQITNIIEGEPIRYTTVRRDNGQYKLKEVAHNRYYYDRYFIVIERSVIINIMNDIMT